MAPTCWKNFVSVLYGFGRPEIEGKAKVNDIVNLRWPSLASVIHVCRLGHPQSNTKQRLFKNGDQVHAPCPKHVFDYPVKAPMNTIVHMLPACVECRRMCL